MKRVLVHRKIRGPPDAVILIKRRPKPYKTEVYWTQSVVHLFCVILSEATALGGFFATRCTLPICKLAVYFDYQCCRRE